jgi:amino-acid N-acetyltransferase
MCWSIRAAGKADVVAIKELILKESESSAAVLPRSSIDYHNYIIVEEGGKLIGCVGYKVWDKILPELISAIVDPSFRNLHIGESMVAALVNLVRHRGYRNLMLLTPKPEFFRKCGFEQVDVGLFPAKILADCAKCPKNLGSPLNPLCPDVAMVIKLQ